MRILFISSLPETNSGGPKHSVPRQVNAQAKYDDVKWFNISPWGVDQTSVPCEIITDIKECITNAINYNPDLVIFEDFQYMGYIQIAKALRRNGIPYVIVPRGSMTKAAQKHKYLKKTIANILFFNKFAEKAAAIEYLTEKEKENASKEWNKNSLIIPNGTESMVKADKEFSSGGLRGVFIGRLNPYHKGLDQFLPACGALSRLIKEKNVRVDMYGPAETGVREQLVNQVKGYGLSDYIHFHGEVHGKEKDKTLREADFFILTSRFEGMPMGLVEALSYGLPVLATEETNMGDVIANSHAGLVSTCNMKEIEKNLEALITAPINLLKDMSQNAYSLSKDYNWDNIANRAHEQYINLIGDPKHE